MGCAQCPRDAQAGSQSGRVSASNQSAPVCFPVRRRPGRRAAAGALGDCPGQDGAQGCVQRRVVAQGRVCRVVPAHGACYRSVGSPCRCNIAIYHAGALPRRRGISISLIRVDSTRWRQSARAPALVISQWMSPVAVTSPFPMPVLFQGDEESRFR